jgi:hypothetical protein
MKRFVMALPLVPLLSVALFAQPAFAQTQSTQTIVRDPEAIAILQASISAMGATLPSDSVASGTVQIVAGSLTSTGTIRVLTKGTAQTLVELKTTDSTRSTIYSSGQANDLAGSTVKKLPLELVMTSQGVEFPLPFIVALLNDSDTSFQYLGVETSNGISLHHIKAWNSFSSQPGYQILSNFTLRDIWIGVSSLLPQRISCTRRPALGAASVAFDVFYNNYQNYGGVAYPLAIQESLNGTPWATITIQAVAFNHGLTDADFPVQ